jgi:predicted DNA-binding ribbon-helix-helix protein
VSRVQLRRDLSIDDRHWRILKAEAAKEDRSVSSLVRQLADRIAREDGKALR